MLALQSGPDLHPAVERLLSLAAAADEAAAARARRVIDRMADAIGEHARAESSTLSRTGFPLEVAFTTADAEALRYTLEGAPPSVPAPARVGIARSLFEQWHGAPLPAPVGVLVDAASATPELTFGAWLGARHSGGADAFKLYVETPRAVAWRWEQQFLPPPTPWNPAGTLHMAGFDGDRVELYVRAERLGAIGLEASLARVGLERRTCDLFDCFAAATGRPIRGTFPVADLGFSYSISMSGAPPRFSLYAFANSLFGGDGRIRESILRVARSHGWSLPLYEAVSAPLHDRRGFLTHHGMFGAVVCGDAPPALAFGLTPPEVRA